jgi:hypothetical protein
MAELIDLNLVSELGSDLNQRIVFKQAFVKGLALLDLRPFHNVCLGDVIR